jgi:hypothetical protein
MEHEFDDDQALTINELRDLLQAIDWAFLNDAPHIAIIDAVLSWGARWQLFTMAGPALAATITGSGPQGAGDQPDRGEAEAAPAAPAHAPDPEGTEGSLPPADVPVPPAAGGGTSSPEAAPPAAGGGRWTDKQDGYLLDLRAKGMTIRQIAAVMGRTEKSVSLRFYKRLKSRGKTHASATTLPPPAASDDRPAGDRVMPAPAPAVPPTPPAPMTPLRQRMLEIRLNNLGHVAPWTPETDLALVEAAMAGRTALTEFAEYIGVDRPRAVARFNDLSGGLKDYHGNLAVDDLQRLHQVLIGRAGPARQAAE